MTTTEVVNKKRLTIRMTTELDAAVRRSAAKRGMTLNQYIISVLVAHYSSGKGIGPNSSS